MKFCVVGAGSIGGYVGVKLALAGEDVTLIARGANLEAIRARGMRLTMADGTDYIAPGIKATARLADAGPHDVVILGTHGLNGGPALPPGRLHRPGYSRVYQWTAMSRSSAPVWSARASPPHSDVPVSRSRWSSLRRRRRRATSGTAASTRSVRPRVRSSTNSASWDALDASRVQPVARMAVFGDTRDSRLEFSAYDAGVATLAHILESGRLAHALWERSGGSRRSGASHRRAASVGCRCGPGRARAGGRRDHPRRARGWRGRRALLGAARRGPDRARRELWPARRRRELRDRQAPRRRRVPVVPTGRGARLSAAAGEPNVDGVVHLRGPWPRVAGLSPPALSRRVGDAGRAVLGDSTSLLRHRPFPSNA